MPTHTGTAQAGSANTLTLAVGASVVNDAYKNHHLRLASGPGSVQEHPVSAYDGATKVATVSPRWRTNLLSRSEELELTPWIYNAVTVSPNEAPDLNGAMTLDRCTVTLGGGSRSISQSFSVIAAIYVFSFEIRAGNRNSANFSIFQSTHEAGTPFIVSGPGIVSGTSFMTVTDLSTTQTTRVGVILSGPPGAGGARVFVYPGSSGEELNNFVYFGRAQVERADAHGEYIKTEASAITLPNNTTGYEVIEIRHATSVNIGRLSWRSGVGRPVGGSAVLGTSSTRSKPS